MKISTFYHTIKRFLLTHKKHQIFLRTGKSLGHAYREIDVIAQNDNEAHLKATDSIDNEANLDIKDSTNNQTSLNDQHENCVEIKANFFGLFGSSSPLSNYILDKFSRNEDSGNGFSLFFDYLNNHVLWLLYESISLRNYHRSFNEDLNDRISLIFLKILGFNNAENAKEYLPFSPLILSSRRPKPYIEKVLQQNFNLNNRISIIENIPQQIPINITQQNILGTQNTILGKNFLLGKTICSHQNKILLNIKDLHYHEALAYFPNQIQFNRLKESISFLTNNEFAIDLRLNIKYSSQMNFILGNLANAKLGFCLLLGGGQKNLSNEKYCKYISLHQ